MGAEAIVMDIQRFSIHDGPGVRTTVFLKGCHLRCQWCHNPESQLTQPQLLFYEERCIGCGQCSKFCIKNVCKPREVKGTAGNHIVYGPDLSVCQVCDNGKACAESCPAQVIQLCGQKMTVQQVMTQVEKDIDFYEDGGGVTFSGGEPLLQHSFLEKILPKCAEKGISVCLDTTLEVPWEFIEPLLKYVKLFLVDVKVLDPKMAKRYQGCAYRYLPENLKRLSDRQIPVIIRVPIAAGVNDTPEEIQKREALLGKLTNVVRVDSFAVSDHGASKYRALQRKMLWQI